MLFKEIIRKPKCFDIEKNYIETKKYFELSSKQNRSIGLCYMDILYSKGLGVELN